MTPAADSRRRVGRGRVYFIRHGETSWSLSGQHTGRTDLPLTAHGEAQASAVGMLLRGIPFAQVLVSPMRRAQRTCALAELGLPSVTDADLSEWDYGDDEGRTSHAIRRERPGWNVFRDGCPNGETPAQIGSRADRLIARLRGMEGNVALYSHGQFGSVLAVRWIGLPVVDGQYFHLDAASLSILGWDLTHPDVPVIALWNETPRLSQRKDQT